jgi:bilirubin oxidase
VVTANATLAVQGTSAGPSAGVTGVSVNGVVATSSDGFATWSANVPLGFGSNLLTATVTGPTGNAVSKSVAATLTTPQAYNPLVIPEAITGPDFDLTLATATKQFRAGSATPTLGFNGALFWGPTLIMNRGDVVRMKVHNALTATTTVHWHGFHLPATMDGGPLQPILPGATWSPSWTVKNSAATYWYHPHLHETTQEQLTKGAGGLIIVRDPEEAALGLPRTYGVDDIPLAVTSRRFLTDNSFAYDHIVDNYGDYVLVNGTLNPRANLPRQFVRLRVLNAEIERGYNLGFSDNRTFYVIGNDSGLLDAPVAVTRVKLMVGERIEILVNLGNDAVGGAVDLRAFNSGQVFGFPGNEGNPVQPTGRSGPINGSLLNNTDFNLLRINVVAATANPVTSLPGTLVKNTYWTNAQVTNTRTVTITGGGGGSEFTFDGAAFSATRNNFTVKLNAIERWTIVNNNIFGHAFHVHDVKFKVVARTPTVGQVSTDGLPAPYESGWKDTVYVPKGESVQVIATFEDYASTTDAYMFHCHFANHEDGGMMGRFVVYDPTIATDTRAPAFRLQPQPMAAVAGATVRLRAEVDSAAVTSYQWYFRGGEFCNTEQPVLELRDLTPGHSGEHFCVATNPFGSTRSKSATLTVAPAAVVPLAVMPQP